MASQIYMSVLYMLIRTSLWIIVFALALLDGLRHIGENARARKLYAGVVIVLGAMVVQDVLLTLYAIGGGDHFGAGALFKAYIFATDAADSLFTALLLTIAAGFCITREDLGPYKLKVTIIPAVYFVTILVVDYTMNAVRGRAAFNVADLNKPGQPVEFDLPSWQRLLLVICAFVNLMALMAAWVYVFDTIQKEREMLEQPEVDVYGEAEAGQRVSQAAAMAAAQARQEGAPEDTGAGHVVLPPVDDATPETYGEVTGEDLDGPKTVEGQVARLAKIRLLKQFSYGVIAYVLATALVVLLPIFVSPEASAGEQAVRVVLVLQNVVLLVFMGGLAWIFRLRGDSPYLMVGEEEGGNSDAADGDQHLRTELGVLGEDEEGEDERRRGGSPHGSDRSMEGFTLHDVEDDEPESRAEAGRSPVAVAPAAAAAPQPPQSEAPKEQLLKGIPKSDEAH